MDDMKKHLLFCFRSLLKRGLKATKKNIVINSKTNRLSTEQINRMIRVAEIFADEDKLVKERINAKNELES
jgi:molecular chaperone DnaK (HSP70)